MNRLTKIFHVLTVFWILYTPLSVLRGAYRTDPLFFGLTALMAFIGLLDLAQELIRRKKNSHDSDDDFDDGDPEI